MSKSKILNPKSQIETWPDADGAMEELAKLDAARRAIAARRDLRVTQVESQFNGELNALADAEDAIEKSLKAFAGKRKAEFKPAPSGDGRSYQHAGVAFGYRRTPPAVHIEEEEAAIRWLTDRFEEQYVRVKQEPDREALKVTLLECDERTRGFYAAHGISLKSKDKFFCEVETKE